MVLLLVDLNRLRRIAELHAERTPSSCDADVLIAEATNEVERLLRGLLLRESKRVGFDLRFDGRTHLRRRSKESIRRHGAIDALVRPLKVVVLDE
jgi:hypothetical protein